MTWVAPLRPPEMHTCTGAELSTFLRATRSDRLSSSWHLLALTGLRRGEALALRWSDLHFDHGRLALQRQRVMTGTEVSERQTKTGKKRAVSMDADAVAVLRRQSQQQLDDAAEWGDAWQSAGHCFTRELHARERRAVAAEPDREALRPGGEARRRVTPTAARPRPCLGEAGATGRRPSQGRAGTPRAREQRDHHGHVQSCHARHAGERGGDGGGPGRA